MHVFTHASSVSSTLGLVALKNSCLVFTLWDLGFEVKLLFWARVGLGLGLGTDPRFATPVEAGVSGVTMPFCGQFRLICPGRLHV